MAGVSLQGGTISGTTGVLTSGTTYDAKSGSASAVLAGSVGLAKTTNTAGHAHGPEHVHGQDDDCLAWGHAGLQYDWDVGGGPSALGNPGNR